MRCAWPDCSNGCCIVRDALIFLIVFGSIPFIFKRPALGIIVFAWLSLMNPHRLTYGSAYTFPFALLISVIAVLAMVTSKEKKSFPMTPVTITLLLFSVWMTFTSLFALEPSLVWTEWSRVMKTFLMIFVCMMVLRSEQDIKWMAWVVALSIGFYGLKGGIFTILSGGSSHVYGPDDTYISDNNCLALALVTVLPLLWYLKLQLKPKLLQLGATALVALTLVAAAGSYSRGALLGGGAMLFVLWIKSQNKIRTGLVLLLAAPLVYLVMPEQWFGRMETIDNYQEDASALGRFNAWGFAMNIAKTHPLGGGYSVFTPRLFSQYAPVPTDHHAAHSIYFQVLGEHGYIGLFLFCLFLFLAWRTGARIIRQCRAQPELRWASDLAAMAQVSIVGYAVGGAFLTLAYYDLIYFIVAILVVLERHLAPARAVQLSGPRRATAVGAAKELG